jgi:hypothetical protein
MFGDMREEFQMQFMRQFRREFTSQPRQFRPHVLVDFFHPRAEPCDLEDLEIGRFESQGRHITPLSNRVPRPLAIANRFLLMRI